MYVVTEKEGLRWVSSALEETDKNKCTKSGWDELTLQLREKALLTRTAILCEKEPNWFGNEYEPRTRAAQYTAWNILVEFQRLEMLPNGYFIFVSPTLRRGFKFEIVGWKDVVKIFIQDNGNINWRIYRETTSIDTTITNVLASTYDGDDLDESYAQEESAVSQPHMDKCECIAKGLIEAYDKTMHPQAGSALREALQAVLKPFENNKPATT